MATLETSIVLHDNFSASLISMTNNLNNAQNAFDGLRNATDNVVNSSGLDALSGEVLEAESAACSLNNTLQSTALIIYDGIAAQEDLNASLREAEPAINSNITRLEEFNSSMLDAVESICDSVSRQEEYNRKLLETVDNINATKKAQDNLNESVKKGEAASNGMLGNIRNLVKAYASFRGAMILFSWVTDKLELSDTKRNAETQLKQVLANVAVPDIMLEAGVEINIDSAVNTLNSAYDQIAAKAQSIQDIGIYDSTAMLGGAGELATYLSDVDAIESMMDTLSNYAMGMSGGGEIDTKAMVEYATQLGKALEGSYDGLTKKGFALSDAQKEIIENGTDMERALVLGDVISQSWEGLYETMSNTPEGQIIQFKNAWSDIATMVGDTVYPAVMQLLDVVMSYMPQITTMIEGASGVVSNIISVVSVFANAAGQAISFLQENWDALAAALAATLPVIIALLATKVALWAIANVKMLAVIAVIGRLAVIFSNFGITAIDVLTSIGGGVNVVIQFFKNLGLEIANVALGIWGALGAVAYNMQAAFHNAIASVKAFFYDLLSTVMSVISKIAEALNKLPFIEFDISGLVSKADEYATEAAEERGSIEDFKSISEAFDNGYGTFETFTDGWASDAYDSGAAGMQSALDSLSDMFDTSAYEYDDSSYTYGLDAFALDELTSGVSDTAANTAAIADTLDYAEEDLKYLRDIAEREAINRFTTAEIRIDQTVDAKINNDMDLDGIVDYLAEDFAERLDVSMEGVY